LTLGPTAASPLISGMIETGLTHFKVILFLPMSSDLVPLQPKVTIGRRAGALCIDAIAVGLPSLLLGANPIVQTIFFILLWLIMRVAIVRKNQGQSLGRWAVDIKIVDPRLDRTPGLQELCKREALLGACAALAFAGIGGLTSTNAGVLLLMLPLAIDCSRACTDTARSVELRSVEP